MNTTRWSRLVCFDGIGAGEPWIVVAGAVGAGCYVAVCYIYWVAAFFELDARKSKEQRSVVPGKEEHESDAKSFPRRFSELFLGQWRFIHFNAPDFPMWVPVLIIVVIGSTVQGGDRFPIGVVDQGTAHRPGEPPLTGVTGGIPGARLEERRDLAVGSLVLPATSAGSRNTCRATDGNRSASSAARNRS